MGQNQVHDFNPGVAPDGLFWTMPIHRKSVAFDLDDGTAAFHMTGLAIPDFHDIVNALSANPTTTPGVVSFDVRWHGKPGTTPMRIRDASNGFVGEYLASTATIAWSAHEPATHFRFATDPAATSTTVNTAVIGHERNGRFFH
ncbi:MAG TPA: hypothetical protein VFL91_16460 [Thermomicrobiales bacterium]|nr:hypothetical protein [Thermomicrobiales bacterium]